MTATTSMGARAADGAVVSARLFAPEQPADATHLVLLAGAFAVRQRYYARFARDLVERGLAVVTVDYRGVGESRHSMPPGSGRRARSGKAPMRQHPARATDWVLDLDAAVHAARHHIPDAPLVVVGHSFGGQVLPLMAHADEISRVVTVGTQFASTAAAGSLASCGPRSVLCFGLGTSTSRLRLAIPQPYPPAA